MTAKAIRIVCLLAVLFTSLAAHAADYSDEQLLEIGKKAFERWAASKNSIQMVQILREEFAPLDDAQRTRAMVFWIYDLDAKSRYPGKHPSPSSCIVYAMMNDRTLVTDPSELKRMIAAENDPRNFFIMCAPASQFISYEKADFVKELSHMLFVHGQVADSDWGEMITPAFKDASYVAYGMIVKNLGTLGAKFAPPGREPSV